MTVLVHGLPEGLEPGEHEMRLTHVEIGADGGPVSHFEYVPPAGDRDSIKVGEFDALGTSWEVFFGGPLGRTDFIARLAGSPETHVRADRYVDLEAKAKVIARRRRAKIRVPFTEVLNDGTSRSGVVYGIHMGSGAKLVEWTRDGTYRGARPGSREQYAPAGKGFIFPELTEAEAAEARSLRRDVAEAEMAWNKWEREHRPEVSRFARWHLDEAVQKAIDEATER